MTVPYLFTYADALKALSDLAQGYGVGVPQEVLRRCIKQAYRQLFEAHDWSFLYSPGRIQLQAAESTGTVVYDHADGTYERQLTLTGAVWPAWAEDAAVRFNSVVCEIESRKSDTVVTLDATLNPGADVASTTFSCYPRWYVLPPDFGAMTRPLEKTKWIGAQNISPTEMLALDRYREDTGNIKYYSIGRAQGLYGSMALSVFPPSNATETLDFVYKKRQRDLRYTGHDGTDYDGTLSVSQDTAAVTGSGTSFVSGMVGSILRLGDISNRPTGLDGLYPWAEQRAIKAVTNTTTLTLDADVTTGYSAVKYVITDPLDFDVAVYDAFLALCARNLAIARDFKDKAFFVARAKDELFEAKGGEGRVQQRRVAGMPTRFVTRLKDSNDVGTVVE